MPNQIADRDRKLGATFLTDEKLASIWSMLDKEKKGFVTLDDLAARAAKKQVRLFVVEVASLLILILAYSIFFLHSSHDLMINTSSHACDSSDSAAQSTPTSA